MKAFVAGAGMVKVDRHYDEGITDLSLKSVLSLQNSVKEWLVPDTILVANAYGDAVTYTLELGSKLSSSLGVRTGPAFRVEDGDASGGASIYAAYSLVKSGEAKIVLVIGAEKLSDFPSKVMNDFYSRTLRSEYEVSSGLTTTAEAGILMRMYIKDRGVDRDYMSRWPIKMHSNGSENPYAYLRFTIDEKTVANSQVLSDPLRLFDAGAKADGAAAVLVVSEEVARKMTETPVEITSVRSSRSERVPSLEFTAPREAGVPVLERLGKVGLVDIHDSYSVMAALTLERVLHREVGKPFEDLEGINMGGGLKARGYPGGATGVYQLAEVFMELAGIFPGKKTNAEKGFILSMDELGYSAYAVGVERK